MAERAYTVSEVEDLRRVLSSKWLFGSYSPNFGSGNQMTRSYMPGEKDAAVEQMVRTHMLAGHTAGDLLADERERRAKWAADLATLAASPLTEPEQAP